MGNAAVRKRPVASAAINSSTGRAKDVGSTARLFIGLGSCALHFWHKRVAAYSQHRLGMRMVHQHQYYVVVSRYVPRVHSRNLTEI